MKELQLLVKCIKHDNIELLKLRPDLFPSGIVGHSDLALTDDHVEEFLKAVSQSGLQEDVVTSASGRKMMDQLEQNTD